MTDPTATGSPLTGPPLTGLTATGPTAAGPRRLTKQRAAIVQALETAGGFRSAQQLHDQLRASGLSLGLATVYRTLQSLADDGEVSTRRLDAGQTAYRLCSRDDHHHHLTCRQCGLAVEIAGAGVEAWAAAIAQQHGFSQADHTIEVTGLCPACTGYSILLAIANHERGK